MKNFVKFGVPLFTVVLIIAAGYILFKPDNASTTKTVVASSQGCPVKYQPNVKKYSTYPSMCIDTNKNYTATIHTSMGDIVVKLLPKNAPKTVNNFVFLAKSGFYNNLTFHRIIPGFVIQGGDPNGDGSGTPGYSFTDEINAQSLGLNSDEISTNEQAGYNYSTAFTTVKFLTGTVGMANSGPNTNGSQFFIDLADQPTLDGKYTPFAEVTGGMDVVNNISNVQTDSSSKPLSPIIIKSVDITESN